MKKIIAFFLAALLLCAAASFGTAVDLDRPCSITVSLSNLEDGESLAQADLVVDVYQIASAIARDGEDAWDFQLLAPFTALELPEDDGLDAWQGFAAEAALLAVDEGAPLVSDAPVETPITATNSGTPLPAGLYLLLVHGKRIDDYLELDDNGTVASVGYAEDYKYLFAPQLLSLPTKTVEEGAMASTDLPGEWIYDVTALLKAERTPRFGNLVIEKTLLSYGEGKPGVFIFDIEAVFEGQTVYSDVVCLQFDAAGSRTVTIDRIPVGAEVTVTEVYSGASYHAVTAASQTVQLLSPEPETVRFVNDLSNTPMDGAGVDNAFTYGAEGWTVTQTPDRSEGGAGQ